MPKIDLEQWTRAKKGRQADICKTNPGRVDKTGHVVVCCDMVWCTSCEALATINKIFSSKGMDSVEQAGQAGGNCGMEGCGVEIHGVGMQIGFRCNVWCWRCHGGTLITVHKCCPCETAHIPETHFGRTLWKRLLLQSAHWPGCPGCMRRRHQSPADMPWLLAGADAEKTPCWSTPTRSARARCRLRASS